MFLLLHSTYNGIKWGIAPVVARISYSSSIRSSVELLVAIVDVITMFQLNHCTCAQHLFTLRSGCQWLDLEVSH